MHQIFLSLLSFTMACKEEPTKPIMEIDEEQEQTLDLLKGDWLFESELVTDCPGGDDNPFDGVQHFDRSEDALLIPDYPMEDETTYFYFMGNGILESHRDDNFYGCVLSSYGVLEVVSVDEEELEIVRHAHVVVTVRNPAPIPLLPQRRIHFVDG